ncbi:hypothetical protein KL86DES1_20943 [uncultured Desulfovibrio sp.]|uniref:Uncharacterized protein n=1 Tax=uncultured Desulfovibrio sp. TaxID=167968 RepID=A0A212L601_9BACT|nr:hypothetical protein KL86DES1_20943 [uncultured Desulfovibrio sp.]VZH33846.1 conserved protein of unknown function [Desulfovibrio sp. 86]
MIGQKNCADADVATVCSRSFRDALRRKASEHLPLEVLLISKLICSRQCRHEMNFLSYLKERASYAGSVLCWYSPGIKGEIRRGNDWKGARDKAV